MLNCSVTRGSEQEFGVAAAAVDGRGDDPKQAPVQFVDECRDVVADSAVNGGVAHNSFFYGAGSGLKLGLDQRNEFGRSFAERGCSWQDQLERNEADVDGDQLRCLVELSRGQRTNVDAFERYNFRPRTQRP